MRGWPVEYIAVCEVLISEQWLQKPVNYQAGRSRR